MRPCDENVSDHELAVLIQDGDRGAFAILFRRYYEDLCGFVESRTGPEEVAEDLVQNVLLSLWRRRCEWELKTSLRAYLFGAARNESLEYREHRKVRADWAEEVRRDESPPTAACASASTRQHELERVIKKAVDELPERRREVYVLSRQHGLTYEEIATVMDISPKTVDNQMVAALKFLRKRLLLFSPQ